MNPAVVRRLDPDATSASAARRLVASVASDHGMHDVVDEAMLLVTEVVTNAVVHAGTDIDLFVEVDGAALRVEVVDRNTAPVLKVVEPAAGTSEGGRGLFLLDALATEWGTRYFRSGKAVWFQLGPALPGRGGRTAPAVLAGSALTGQALIERPARRDLGWLLSLPADLEARLTTSQLVGELVHRLSDALDVARCWVFAEAPVASGRWELRAASDPLSPPPPADDAKRNAVAAQGSVQTPTGALIPLRSGRGTFGVLVLDGESSLPGDALALARLVADRIGLVIRDEHADQGYHQRRESLAMLTEASELFAGTLDVQLALTLATRLVVPRLASWAAAWTTHGPAPALTAWAHTEESRLDSVRDLLASPEMLLLAGRLRADADARRPVRLRAGDLPPGLLPAGSGDVHAVPLVARRRLVGLLLAGRDDRSYAADELSLLHDLGRRAAIAVESARLYEERAEIARALQDSLLPPVLPKPDGIDFGARYDPAGEGNDVGGDFYDVFSLSGDTWGLAIGDVCGKGAHAAAITGMARDVLRLLIRDGASPGAALMRLNKAILDLDDRARFCTAVSGWARPDGDNLRVRLAAAGHPPPVLVRSGGEVSLLATAGTVLGVLDEIDLEEDDVLLRPGDALVFYTDGVTERRDGMTMFGEQRLMTCLRDVAGRPADVIAGRLAEAAARFSSSVARDDVAVLVVRCAERQLVPSPAVPSAAETPGPVAAPAESVLVAEA